MRSLTLRWSVGAGIALAAIWFALRNGSVLTVAASALGHASPAPLALGLVLSGAAIANRAGLNRAAHQSAGVTVPPFSMISPAAIGFAADKVVRSAGASGVAVMVRHGSGRRYRRGSVLAACALASVASFAALGCLLVVALGLVALRGQLTMWWLAAGLGFTLYAVAGVVGATVLARHREFGHRIWAAAVRRAPRLMRMIGLSEDPSDALTLAFMTARRRPEWMRRVFTHALLSKGLGVGMLLAASWAVGVPLTVPRALVVYASVLLISMASIIPGGLGVVEASTVAMLASSGAGWGNAVLAVAVFRVLDLWLPLLAGAVLAWSERGKTARVDDVAVAAPLRDLVPDLVPGLVPV